MRKFVVIKCPKCGAEYLPAEIFFSDKLLGYPKNIIKNKNGKIEYFDGDTMCLTEEYTCDYCECTFIAEAKVVFESSVNICHDFSEDYSVSLYEEERASLTEPEEESLW